MTTSKTFPANFVEPGSFERVHYVLVLSRSRDRVRFSAALRNPGGRRFAIRHRSHVVITPHHKHTDDAMMDYLLPRWHVAWRIGGVSKMLISPGMTDSAPADTPVAEEIVAGIAVETDSLVPSSLISIEEFSTPFYGFASGILRATQLVRIGNIARA